MSLIGRRTQLRGVEFEHTAEGESERYITTTGRQRMATTSAGGRMHIQAKSLNQAATAVHKTTLRDRVMPPLRRRDTLHVAHHL